MGTIKTTNIEPIADNGTVTLGSSGDTFTVPSGVTVNMSSATQTGVGGTNTPSFQAYMNGNQTISNASYNKLEMDAEVYDSDGKYDTSNYRFTPTVAGKYWVWGKFRYDDNSDIDSAIMAFYKNGSIFVKTTGFQTYVTTIQMAYTIELDTDDYIEIYAYQNSGGNSTINGNSSYPEQDIGTWGAYRIIT
jgi:hypothetical protein